MPFALLEAMAVGCPVIVTPETNIAQWISEYNAGWVTTGSIEELTASFLVAAQTPSLLLDQKGSNARRVIREFFTWPKVATQMAAEYARLLNGK